MSQNKMEDLEVTQLEEMTDEELRAVAGGLKCGTAGTYDSKEGVCCPDTVCY